MTDKTKKTPFGYFFGCLPKIGLSDAMTRQRSHAKVAGQPSTPACQSSCDDRSAEEGAALEDMRATANPSAAADSVDFVALGKLGGTLGGGRPAQFAIDRRGVGNGIDISNRLPAGVERRRQELLAHEAMAIIGVLKQERPKYATEKEFWQAMCMRYRPRTKQMLL